MTGSKNSHAVKVFPLSDTLVFAVCAVYVFPSQIKVTLSENTYSSFALNTMLYQYSPPAIGLRGVSVLLITSVIGVLSP